MLSVDMMDFLLVIEHVELGSDAQNIVALTRVLTQRVIQIGRDCAGRICLSRSKSKMETITGGPHEPVSGSDRSRMVSGEPCIEYYC